MMFYRMCWKFVLLLLGVAAAAPSPLKCNVTRQPDGSIMYQLSQQPRSPRCETCWENWNKTVFAHENSYDPKQVQNLTNQSIALRVCQDYLHYTKNCDGVFDDAHCNVNCSLFVVKDPPGTTLNSTLTCFFGIGCLDQMTVGLCIGAILLTAVVVGGLFIMNYICKRIRRGESVNKTVSYTPVNGDGGSDY